jgi:hypothetical protein
MHPNGSLLAFGCILGHPNVNISMGWIKIHPLPESYPVLAGFFFDFLTDIIIIKSRKNYIEGHFWSLK